MNRGPKPKTIRDLPADWHRKILTLARQGLSEREIREHLGISITLFYALMKREPKFRNAVLVSRQERLSWRLDVAI